MRAKARASPARRGPRASTRRAEDNRRRVRRRRRHHAGNSRAAAAAGRANWSAPSRSCNAPSSRPLRKRCCLGAFVLFTDAIVSFFTDARARSASSGAAANFTGSTALNSVRSFADSVGTRTPGAAHRWSVRARHLECARGSAAYVRHEARRVGWFTCLDESQLLDALERLRIRKWIAGDGIAASAP